jgi:hypothetical protein
MIQKISNAWRLMGMSFSVLKDTPSLLLFPLLSGISCAVVIASFIIPLSVTEYLQKVNPHEMSIQQRLIGIGIAFAFYFCNYFVITFFNVCIVTGAMVRMAGGEPTIGNCFAQAFKRIHLIAGWALVAATVGMILKALEQRLGKLIVSILGTAWTMMTFMVVPVMVLEEKGPIDALKQSAKLLTKNWGERVVGNFAFGLIFFALSLLGVGAIVFGGYITSTTGSPGPVLMALAAAVIWWILLGLVSSALTSIFQTAVYMYTQGVKPMGFDWKFLKASLVATGEQAMPSRSKYIKKY